MQVNPPFNAWMYYCIKQETMRKLFNKILVPVNFSSRSKRLVHIAADIARRYDCSIHLLHVVAHSPFSYLPFGNNYIYASDYDIDNKKEIESQMQKCGDAVNCKLDDENRCSFSIVKGSWNEGICQVVKDQNIDLVLIGQKPLTAKRHMRVNPDTIATRTDCAVITIPVDRDITKIRSIVIPVTDFIPEKKLMYGAYVASVFHATIKLLGIENDKTKNSVGHLLKKSCNLLKNYNGDVTVHLEKRSGDNTAGTVNEFAGRSAADLIIVNPGTQTRMPGFLSALWGNILQRYSRLPVLTINLSELAIGNINHQ